jgi:cob(I)alamin adenosyltransferase
MLWTLDERWILAETEGAALLEQMRELYRWQEEEGGDPLRFRSEKKEIYQKLEPIQEKLIGLKAELAGHPGAAGLIEQRIREFSGALSGVLR